MAEIPNLKFVIENVRRQYPTPLGDRHRDLLAELPGALTHAAPDFRFGLLKKTSGTRITLRGGAEVAQDIITVHMGDHLRTFDVLGSGETKATAQWNATKPTGRDVVEKFYEVTAEDWPLDDDDNPLPPDDEDDEVNWEQLTAVLGELAIQVGNLEQRVKELEADILHLIVDGPTSTRGAGPLKHHHHVKLAVKVQR
jgi:hypothetical protein